MIRYSLLTIFVTFLVVYSFRDWYRSLCGLVVLMAFIERYDMPRQMLGITGLNPWNLLMVFIVLAVLVASRNQRYDWNFPGPTKRLLQIYFVVVVVGIVRMALDFNVIQQFFIYHGGRPPAISGYLLDDFFNTLKYAVPGMLMFYGCISRERLLFGIGACLLASFLIGLQIIKWMPLGALADANVLSETALRLLDRAIGYHRVDLAALMASASWGFFVVRGLAPNKLVAWALTAAGVVLILALALTGGRTGYGTWLALAMIFAVLKWKRLIFVAPIAVLIVITIVPAARDRMLYGIVPESDETGVIYESEGSDLTKVTSDRVLIWPIVIDEIVEAPLIGYGRHGLLLSDAGTIMRELYGEKGELLHPHNAYLEIILDNGIVGALPILIFFWIVMIYSIRLFRNRESTALMASGGLALAMIGGQLIASIGGQSFYPRAGVVIMWCTIGMALRSYAILQDTDKSKWREFFEPEDSATAPAHRSAAAATGPRRSLPGNYS